MFGNYLYRREADQHIIHIKLLLKTINQLFLLYGYSFNNSGAIYRGVPLMEVIIALLSMGRAKPKSQILIIPEALIKTF